MLKGATAKIAVKVENLNYPKIQAEVRKAPKEAEKNREEITQARKAADKRVACMRITGTLERFENA